MDGKTMFKMFDETNGPDGSRDILKKTKAEFKMIPNLERTMAGAPALLEAYSITWNIFKTTTLSEVEQQIVYQTANFENECNYCVPWHTLLSRQAGMKPNDIEALREGSPLSDKKHEQLRRFTQALIRTKGKVVKADLAAFFDVGYTEQNALEVILGIAIKTMSNYTNSIAGTPLDKAVEKLIWNKPLTHHLRQVTGR
jgi:uncharacterized peroxidase-related enzyme